MLKLLAKVPGGAGSRQWIFVSANVCLVCVIWFVGVQPVIDILSNESRRLGEAAELRNHYRAVIGREPLLLKAKGKIAPLLARIFVVGTSEGALNAELQKEVKALAESSGMRVASITTIEPKNRNSVWFIGTHADLSGSIAAQTTFLKSAASHRPLLFVENAALRIPAQTGESEREPLIDVQLEIYQPALDFAPAR